MTKRKIYEPNLPKKRGPKKIYGDEPLIDITVRLPVSQWERILTRCPAELRQKNSAVMRWVVDELLGK